jgi:predicted nucleic acid-binding protein
LILIDTDVLIDVLRKHERAERWLRGLAPGSAAVAVVSAMELIQGCRDGTELRRTERLLDLFDMLWPSPGTQQLAYRLFREHWLSSAIGINDTLIAASALTEAMSLCTFNRKHFRVIPGLQLVQPYDR